MKSNPIKVSRGVKADPGYFYVLADEDDTGRPNKALLFPIIEWVFVEYCPDQIPYPVTLQGVKFDEQRAILRPDGRVEIGSLETVFSSGLVELLPAFFYENLAEWLGDQQAYFDDCNKGG